MDDEATKQTGTTTETAPTPLEQAAEELLRARVRLVRDIETASTRAQELREQLSKAERSESEAWSAATSAGWTASELKQLGLTPPAGQRGGRPRGSRGRRTTTERSTSKAGGLYE